MSSTSELVPVLVNNEGFVEHDRTINVGDLFLHFKGAVYQVVGLALHTETSETLVIYRNINRNQLYARPESMFLSEVDHEKYPDIKQKYRFVKVALKNVEK